MLYRVLGWIVGFPLYLIGKLTNNYVVAALIFILVVRLLYLIFQAFSVNAKNRATMQIRTDPGTVKWKYSTFTSVKQDGGCKAIVELHYIRGEDTTVVYLTEGALKAEVAKSLLSSKYKNNRPSFMAIPGVNGTKALENALDYLKNQGVVKIKDCFDMDKSGNDDTVEKTAVRDAVEKIKQMCLDKGFQWQTVEWPTQKGIDDYSATCSTTILIVLSALLNKM